ncbi:MAG: phosphatase PAP2 family protein [Chloroflexi bacterium]|nr:phosphatase PAP2 family protein [Chloroflexota bacterium]
MGATAADDFRRCRQLSPNRPGRRHAIALIDVGSLDVERISEFVDRFDDRVDLLFEKLRGRPWADRVFYTASQLGDYGLIWLLLAALAALGGSWRAERNLWRLAAVLGLDSMFVNGLLKSLIKRSRPLVDDGERPLYLRRPITTAFPSGHASSAVVAALLLGEMGGRRWRRLLWLMAATVALSRIHVRIHHASDVAGGLLTGAVLGRLARRIWPLG